MLLRFPCLAIVLCCAACGSHGAQGPRAHSELDAQDAALFEDGVDLIEDPEQLEGQWRTNWDRDLDRRIAQSDLVALGNVTTVRADVDLEHRTSYQVVLGVERVLEGDAHGKELTLISRQGAAGYASIDGNRERLLNRKLVVFMRYVSGEGGSVVSHFHLAAPSQSVLHRVDEYEGRRGPARVRIIEHSQ